MTTGHSDENCIKKAIAGDTAAFRLLVDQHKRFVYAVAFRLVGDKEEAEDISQEAFIRLWKNLRKYRPEVKLTTWLYKIITNLCLDYLKSGKRRKRLLEGPIDDLVQVAGLTRPDETMMHDELKSIVIAVAETLTPKQRIVFTLRDIEGLAVEEVAAICDMSAGTIKSNLYYARMKIAQKINAYYQYKKVNGYEV
jgi:RNA polymerase sigma-70 factor, ECF subfamily